MALMLEPPSDHEPTGLLERAVYWLFIVGVPSLLAAEVIVDYQPAKLGVLFFILFWFLLLVVHEAGHAVVSAALGWRVGMVMIGMGRPIASFRIRQTPVVVCLLPLEGFVVPLPTSLEGVRWKSALIYFAGPAAEMLVLGLLIWLLGLGNMLTRTDQVAIIAAQSMAVVIIISVFINLMPHCASTQNGVVPNDGLGIICSFSRPMSDYAELIESQEKAIGSLSLPKSLRP